MCAEDYFAYARRQRDDAPLYLFDPHFAEQSPALAADYAVPAAFDEDLLATLGAARPEFRCARVCNALRVFTSRKCGADRLRRAERREAPLVAQVADLRAGAVREHLPRGPQRHIGVERSRARL